MDLHFLKIQNANVFGVSINGGIIRTIKGASCRVYQIQINGINTKQIINKDTVIVGGSSIEINRYIKRTSSGDISVNTNTFTRNTYNTSRGTGSIILKNCWSALTYINM